MSLPSLLRNCPLSGTLGRLGDPRMTGPGTSLANGGGSLAFLEDEVAPGSPQPLPLTQLRENLVARWGLLPCPLRQHFPLPDYPRLRAVALQT